MSIFVTGTDTEVGKTIVSAVIMARYGKQTDLGYWKPVATGASTDRDVTTVAKLASSFGGIHDEAYLFDPPVSPHLAARLDGTTIDPESIVRHYRSLKHDHPGRHFVIEGIGGAMVPLTDDGYLTIELTSQLQIPTILVARSTLGTINHTLLSIEALRHRHIPLVGVVMNGPENMENRHAIEQFGDTVVLGEMTIMDPLTAASVMTAAQQFDREAILETHLT